MSVNPGHYEPTECLPFVVHLVVTDCANLPTRHEVMMQTDAPVASLATRDVINWHTATFGPMTVNHIGTVQKTL